MEMLHDILWTACEWLRLPEHEETTEERRKETLCNIAVSIWFCNVALFLAFLRLKGVLV